MNDKVFEGFLRRQSVEGGEFAAQSDVLELLALPGDPPTRYVANYRGRNGLVCDQRGQIIQFDQLSVGIWFPDDYLRRAHVAQVLTYLGPHPEPFHPNMRPPFICAHIEPGTSLVDLLYLCVEIWTWNLFATGDEGLNHAASQWSRKQDRRKFPIDRRPLKRRAAAVIANPPAGKEVA